MVAHRTRFNGVLGNTVGARARDRKGNGACFVAATTTDDNISRNGAVVSHPTPREALCLALKATRILQRTTLFICWDRPRPFHSAARVYH